MLESPIRISKISVVLAVLSAVQLISAIIWSLSFYYGGDWSEAGFVYARRVCLIVVGSSLFTSFVLFAFSAVVKELHHSRQLLQMLIDKNG